MIPSPFNSTVEESNRRSRNNPRLTTLEKTKPRLHISQSSIEIKYNHCIKTNFYLDLFDTHKFKNQETWTFYRADYIMYSIKGTIKSQYFMGEIIISISLRKWRTT